MVIRRQKSQGIESLSASTVRRYLAAWGWKTYVPIRPLKVARSSPAARALLASADRPAQSFDVYVKSADDHDDVELVVPRIDEGQESTRQLYRVVDALAAIKGASINDIVRDILSVGYDVVSSTIPDNLVQDETVSLNRARRFLNGMRDVLASTATTELEPRPFFARVKKEAAEYADHCRFGHTFRGSFGFTLESPVIAPLQQGLDGIETSSPFERRVMTRFATALRAIDEAAKAGDPSIIVEASTKAFGANACEQFADMVDETSTTLIFEVTFSPEWTLPNRSELSRSFTVTPAHVEVTKAAARDLREQTEPRQVTVLGRVVQLANHYDPSDLFGLSGEREIVIQWHDVEAGLIYVRASLDPQDYLLAIDAHASGRSVGVSGLLDHRGRRWLLLDASGFIVLP